MTIVNHQKQTRSQGWGKPCRRRYVFVPADWPQACSDSRPISSGFVASVSSSVITGGGFGRRPFSILSLRVTSRAKAAVLFPSRQMSSRHNFRGGPSRGAFVAASVSRRFHSCLQFSAHAVQSNLADLPELHSFVAFRGGWSVMTNHQPKGVGSAQNLVGENQNVIDC